MPLRHAVALVLIASLLTLEATSARAQPPPRLENVTVIQTDGWKHRRVSVALTDDGASLRITRPDGATLVLPLESVAAIRDAEGRDITRELIPGAPPPASPAPTTPTVEEKPSVATTPPPRPEPPFPFRTTIGGGMGWGWPSGDHYHDFTDGRLVFGDLRFALGPRHYLELAYRVQELFDGPRFYVDRDHGYLDGVAPAEVELRQYLLSVGFLSPPSQGNLLRAYLAVGGGMGDQVLTYLEGPVAGSEHDQYLLGLLRGGVLVFLGQSPLAVDLSLSATFKISGDGDQGGGVVTAAQAGLVVLLGSEY